MTDQPSEGERAAGRGAAPSLRPRDAVRAATMPAHRRLASLPVHGRLLSSDVTRDDYRAVMLRWSGVYDALSSAMAGFDDGRHFRARIDRWTRLLAADVTALEVDPDPSLVARGPLLPQLERNDQALGTMYVFAGSQLGGRMIYTHLVSVFGRSPGLPLRFFRGDGAATDDLWQGFCGTLDADTIDVADVCATAVAVYDTIAAWLDVGSVRHNVEA